MNQYTYSPPFTTEQLSADYFSGLTQSEIAKKYEISQHVVQRAMVKADIPRRARRPRNQSGKLNKNWRGGRTLMAVVGSGRFSDRGYLYRKNPSHPNADRRGYVAEHIEVATAKIGRALRTGECVHHVDLNKHHNTPENLEPCSRKQHREYHLQLEMIAVQLLRQGKVTFTPGIGYALCNSLMANCSQG